MAEFTLDTQGPASKPFHDPYRILALSGGGYRGLFTAALLVELEATGGPLRERFDLITGTSIGSILAGAIALGATAERCLHGMIEHGERIFPTAGRLGTAARRVQQAIVKAPYSAAPLTAAIDAILGVDKDRLLSDVDAALAVPCVSHTRAATQVLRSRGLAGAASSSVSVLEAMLASAAAPTYFPSRTLLSETVIDGGVVANAPEMIGVADAARFGQARLERMHVLSIGTASTSLARAVAPPDAAPAAAWVTTRELFQVTMQAQETLAMSQCRALLGERYVRLDQAPSPQQARVIGLDCADEVATATLLDMARECWAAATADGGSALQMFRSA